MTFDETDKFLKKAIPVKQTQDQGSLKDQIFVLISAANRLGLYDAADFLASVPTTWRTYLER